MLIWTWVYAAGIWSKAFLDVADTEKVFIITPFPIVTAVTECLLLVEIIMTMVRDTHLGVSGLHWVKKNSKAILKDHISWPKDWPMGYVWSLLFDCSKTFLWHRLIGYPSQGGLLWYYHTYVGSGHFWGVQNFNILGFFFFGFFWKNEYFWGMKLLWIVFGGHLGVISMHFRVFF